MNYYISETVSEAKVYRDYAKKAQVDVADVRLALAAKQTDTFARPLPQSTIMQVAAHRNKLPLPEIETAASVLQKSDDPKFKQSMP